MASLNTCPSCCTTCSIRQNDMYRGPTPYSLTNLIAAGTIVINFNHPDRQEVLCNHIHSEDDWHTFQENDFKQHILVDADFFQQIQFLVEHCFIAVTYRFGPSLKVFLRIYIIPYDLANVKGKLRVRKEVVLAPARRYMRNLLPKISQNPDHWNGTNCLGPSLSLYPSITDRRTLAEIYGDLKSPQPRITPGWEDITKRLLDFDDNLGGLGMRSSLYNYQRRSVAAMIQKELDLSDVPDPLFIPVYGMNKEPFYLQPGTMEVLRDRPTVAASRSGILCEELGTGKTVMILALVLATVNQISSPEESIIDDRPILTPLSFRHFPSPECVAARRRFFHERGNHTKTQNHIPSLVELLIHHVRTAPDATVPNMVAPSQLQRYQRKTNVIAQIKRIPPGELLMKNAPFYHHYQGEPTSNERVQRNYTDPGPRVVYLTSSTLIIVPPNLLKQWDREIQKHCEYPLRVLMLTSRTEMPNVTSLASDFDIILMTYKRFAMENNFRNKDALHSWKVCRCPEFPETRIPNCDCKVPGVTPLLQIRWKRLVVDEGHVSASLSNILTPFTKLLSVERRWIVTGTPTTNLLGLSLGTKADKRTNTQADEAHSDSSFSDADFSNESQISSMPLSRTGSPLPPVDEPLRVWNKYDRQDLNKLGKMITHFITVPQFAGAPKLVLTHIIEPLFDPQGPRLGSIQVLNQVMEMIMIRHRIEDVEMDVILPPIKQESILLDLDPYAVKSYNAMQATIAINAIDSQRTDQDYMFHPRNVDYLQLTVKNMSQLMFWSADEGLYNVDELAKNAQKHIDVAVERNMPQEDLALLDEAFKHVRSAAEDQLWRAIQEQEDVPYRVLNMHRGIFDAWTRTPQSEPSYSKSLVGFVHADRLLRLQSIIVKRPLSSEDDIIKLGVSVASEDRILRNLYKQSLKGKDKSSTRKSARSQEGGNDVIRKVRSRDLDILKEIRKELDAVVTRWDDCEGEEPEIPLNLTPSFMFHGGSLLTTSLLGQVRLASTASSKLNYIINEVLQHADKEKFLIFSDSQLSLAHLAEALELIHVKFLRFTTQVEPRVREQMVLTFETSEVYRVFLMELKHGARGLNLISASRVIFCEPVWQADVESQAIKRAHRIGQTRSIVVKTLAIRGTAEENMVARRNMLKFSQEKVPKLIEEAGMRHYIANPKFINYAPTHYSTVDIPLLRIEPDNNKSQSASSEKYIRVGSPLAVNSTPLGSSPQKKRVVKFTS